MAISDEDEKKLREELATTKSQLEQLLEEKKQQSLKKPEDDEKEKKGKDEKPNQPKVDPDLVKEIANAKARIEALEKQLAVKPAEKKSDADFFNPFKNW